MIVWDPGLSNGLAARTDGAWRNEALKWLGVSGLICFEYSEGGTLTVHEIFIIMRWLFPTMPRR